MDGFAKSTVWVLAGSMAYGIIVDAGDGSHYRDLRQDGFAIAINSTGPTSLTGGVVSLFAQSQITGEEIAIPYNRWSHIILTDPSRGSTVTNRSSHDRHNV